MAGALEGIRVIDFSWVLAGPGMTRYLADYGAEVIKIESTIQPDVIRNTPPYRDNKPGLNRSVYWCNYHCNKYSASINLKHPRGKELAKRLVATADAVVENFTPGTMESWGLGYPDLVKVKPDIIMVSISLFGQHGPYKNRFGVGTFAEGMSGFLNLFGWPDRPPVYFQQVVGDALVPYFGVSSLLTALEHRDRTGRGQWLDLNQLDVVTYLMAPLLLDFVSNGRQTSRCGNDSPGSSPHAAYPCLGEDKWCVIAVSSDAEWHQLCESMGDPHWAHDPRFATFTGRKVNEAELDSLISTWTMRFPPREVMELLQQKGVPAGAVLTGEGVYADPQFQHRKAVWWTEHPEIGRVGCFTSSFQLSTTPAEPRLPPPRLGEHTERVCTEILKMGRAEFEQLRDEGVFV